MGKCGKTRAETNGKTAEGGDRPIGVADDRRYTRGWRADSAGKEALDENVGQLEQKIANVGGSRAFGQEAEVSID